MSKPEVVVVTGATSGVGRAVAQAFGRRGAHVALLARGHDGLEGAARDVEAAGGKALQLPTDVADFSQVEAAAQATEETFGPIDVWVNDAMTTVFAEFQDIEPDEFRRATEVTYLGQAWGVKAALSRMLPRDRGTIVLVGSALAYRGIPLQSPYCGAKFAVRGMFESLRCELRHQGSNVHLTMVQLPGLNTPQFDHCLDKLPKKPQPVPPIYQPEVAAEAVYWSAHHRRREHYVGISTVYTIWGNKIAPWLAERYLAKTAYSGQQTGQDVSPERRANLFEPVPGDPGAHGDFDSESHERSPQEWLSRHRGMVGAAAAAVGAATALGVVTAVR
ncbi:MAG: SDR family oxidoreductase [Gaiellaceae bacterium]